MMEQDVIMMQQPQKYFKNPYSYWQFKWKFFDKPNGFYYI